MRANFGRQSSLVLLVMSGLAGCGSVSASNTDAGGGNGGTDAPMETAPLTADQACDQMAQAMCNRVNDCAPPALPLYYVDMPTCLARVKLGCTKDQEDADITRTPAEIVACAQALPGATCDDLLAKMVPAACQTKPGARLNGEGCGASLQCMSAHCEVTAGTCGTCAPQSAANGACTSDDGCVVGLVCANKKCVAPGGVGAACSDNNPCRGNLNCNKNTSMCETLQPAGTLCGGDPGVCDVFHGAACNVFKAQANQDCETLSVATGGNPCGIVNGGLTLCVLNNSCTALVNGVCPNPAMDGQTCDSNVHCIPPASCSNGLCRFPSVAGCTR
jgi:hypothetical protein